MKNPISGAINLHGQTAIVTGGARGIGASIVRTLAREGANVVVSDVLPTDAIVSEIKNNGQKCIGITCDVTKQQQIDELIQTTLNHFSTIDIVVAGAGIVERSSLLDLTLEKWNRVIEVNLTGMFLTVQAAYRQMEKKGYGKIVCLGSISGKVGGIISGPHYVASKGGLHSFIKSVAKEAASKGVYVNGIAPGPVKSQMTNGLPYKQESIPLGRLGEPEDIAEATLFLASQSSNFITGQVLNVNGGLFME
ncbi:3-oxoacyl-ACP reductase FabG [Neobacillus cucumis]|uniref:SDR family NAD(P)-dependent oxidoreductase n=1 Tax=Neobacillus cucumis TaxID=1740721 RepID=UPI0018E044FE|nr:3-oxoacyl-ACP reductase family protein [Neobacillus cucumis]MBI0579868.1 3-oxoacyl-ACP reductase FabG [Neobacillus cucumis]